MKLSTDKKFRSLLIALKKEPIENLNALSLTTTMLYAYVFYRLGKGEGLQKLSESASTIFNENIKPNAKPLPKDIMALIDDLFPETTIEPNDT